MGLLNSQTANHLILSLPVRFGKSEYCSVALPAWFLTLFPEKRVMMASHSHSLAGHFGGRVRSLVRDYGPALTGARLHRNEGARDDFRMADGGGLFATSPGASCAGRGGDLIIADDLVKDFAKAASPTARRALAQWFHGELMARKTPTGKVVCVMSRRHPSDLTGELEQLNPELPPSERWHVIRHPALNEQNQSLWPEQWPVDKLEAKRQQYEAAGMSFIWAAEYQQQPTGDLNLLEWPADYFDSILTDELPPPEAVRYRILAVDPSKGSNARSGDYCGITDIRIDHKLTLWVDPTLKRLTSAQIEDTVVGLAKRNAYTAIVVEGNGFQDIIARNITKKAQDQGIALPVHLITNTSDKTVRIRLALSPLLHQRRIKVYAGSTSARLFVQQLQEFPSGAHDDGPDALALGTDMCNDLMNRRARA